MSTKHKIHAWNIFRSCVLVDGASNYLEMLEKCALDEFQTDISRMTVKYPSYLKFPGPRALIAYIPIQSPNKLVSPFAEGQVKVTADPGLHILHVSLRYKTAHCTHGY